VDISSAYGRTVLGLYDPFKRENIGQLFLGLESTTPLIACSSSEKDTLDDCPTNGTGAAIIMRGLGKALVKKSSSLNLTMDGVSVLDIAPNGALRTYPNVELLIDGRETKNFLSISVLSGGIAIGRIGIRMSGSSIVRAPQGGVESTLASNPGSIIYESISPRYAGMSTYLGNSSFGSQGLVINRVEDESK
jgi:hypothetical protein